MKAVILAGGEGTRLRPLTSNQPKPMIPLANRPLMEHVVALLAQHSFDDIVVTVAFLANQIRDYFGDGSDFGVRLRYATEESPLGTAGSVQNASAELDDTFLVISGDVLTDIDLSAFVKAHRDSGAQASIALKHVENPLEFGIVITNADGTVERFLEKPSWGQVFSDTINTGIYVLEPQVFDFIPKGEVVDFSGDVFPAMLANGLPILGHVADGYWEDIGTTEAYLRAHVDVLDAKVKVDIAGFRLGERVWLGEGADVDPDVPIAGPVVIGDNCRIESGAQLGPYSVLGTDVVVKSDASLERVVLHDHVYIGRSAWLRGCAIGRSTDLRSYARVDEGVVIGDECFIGDRAVLSPGVKVYPFKSVEADAVINSSIVWESRGTRTPFGPRGVRGLANVDLTPELAVRLAMAYGTSLPKGSTVTTSRDTSRAARALKRALIAGLNLAGITVEDVELATVPLTRFQVRNSVADGGITVRLAPGDADSVEIRFFDADGRDIDENTQRKIERLLSREDYRRAFAGDIGDIVFPPRAIEFYTAALEASVDAPLLRQRSFKVVLDYSFGAVSMVNDDDGTQVAGRLSPDGLVWSTTDPLDYNERYTLNAQSLGLGGVTRQQMTFQTHSPENLTMPYVLPNEGEVVGIGQPVAVQFDENIPDRLAAQKAIKVTTNPPVEGAFYWLNNREVRWRPAQYWKPGTTVDVAVNIYGVDLGEGLFGQENVTTHFTIGDY